jgi:hypothetical protein
MHADEENNQQNALINSSINLLIEQLISAFCWLYSLSLKNAQSKKQNMHAEFKIMGVKLLTFL